MTGLKIHCLSRYFLIIVLMAAFSQPGEAQISNFKISGAKKNQKDTLSLETAKKITEETAGLLESEVDPTTYILGPNDVLTIAIVSPLSKEIDAIVSPEGKIVIPDVGAISLKDKSLAQADTIIKEKVKKYYRVTEVYVLLKKIRKFKVIVGGSVSKPAIVAATALDRVSEVIDRAGGMKFDASLRHITLRRSKDNRIVPVDLLKFFMLGDKDSNPFVSGGDVINVPTINEKDFIEIEGEVIEPDKFEYRTGDSLSTIIKFAQGFLPSSNLDSVEIVRFYDNNAGINRWFVDINKWRNYLFENPNLPGDFSLESGDRVYIRNKPQWEEDMYVTVSGEVLYPGKYAIKKGETRIREVLERAGGLTDDASVENAVMIRATEMKIEDRQIKRLQTIPASEMSETEYQYFQARILEEKGVMALDFRKILKDGQSYDNALLIHRDSIIIPQKKYFVNVQGRVITPGLVTYRENYTYLDYINAAGGFAYRADESETFIHKTRGEQYLAEDMNYIIEPGDNILVPPKKPSTFWKDMNTALQLTVSLLGTIIIIVTSLTTIK